MAQNYVTKGDVIDLVVTAEIGALTTGATALMGGTVAADQFIGVSLNSAAIGGSTRVAINGVYNLNKTAGQELKQGYKAYYDPATKLIVNASSGTTVYAGRVQIGAAAGAAKVAVNLNVR